ncbi:MAG: sulfite exporter TauE/SafE family protein [Deltaproteobacteria bacterium]|nr:sulfite exporter TauE/SafE family protein [Deltaproteobacteria bacterium]
MGALLSSFQSSLQAGSLLAYALAFLGGLLVSFTPCVYPILPVTVGYIGSRSGGSRRHAFLLSAAYAIGMALTYAALGMAAGLSGSVFGEATAHPLSYLVLGNVCILLSLSLFDVFHLSTPAILTRAGGPGSTPRGMGGALVVGLLSGLVVGPCTAPVLGGLLLYVGASGHPVFGATLLFTFALGMGVPVVALGTFAGLLANLPKAGGWTVKIQRAFGVLLLLAGEYLILEAGKRLV